MRKRPGRLKEAFNQMSLEGAGPAAIGLAVMFLMFLVIGRLELNGPTPVVESLLDGGMLLIAVVSFVALRRRWIPPERASVFISMVLLIAFANSVVTVLLTGKLYALTFVPYVLLACGALLLSFRWFIVTQVSVYAVSVPLLWIAFPEELLTLCPHLLTATIIGVALLLARRELLRKLHVLRTRDTLVTRRLTIALDHSEKALAERVRSDEKRRSLEAQLQQSQKLEAVGVLAGGIAHGMNNLLGAISAYASVLRHETRQGDPRRQEIDEILSAAKRGGELTRNLLGFARKGTFQKTVVDLNHAIRQTVKMMRETLSKHLTIEVGLDKTLPPVFGDPGQIGQVLMNLCINAAEATREMGRVTIATHRIVIEEKGTPEVADLPSGPYCVVRVSDTGRGMDEKTQRHAFDPFFTTKSPNEGTGLGLAMVYGAVRSHGGNVTLRSEAGQGTVVEVFLPVATDDEIAAASRQQSAHPALSEKVPKRVLLVDDEPMIRSSGRRILRRLGCDVLLASNGVEALEVVEKAAEVDLVILDVAMPVMDGAECFYKLRTLNPRLPVVISSGFADDAHTERLIADGAAGLLPKPYDLDQMSAVVRVPGAEE